LAAIVERGAKHKDGGQPKINGKPSVSHLAFKKIKELSRCMAKGCSSELRDGSQACRRSAEGAKETPTGKVEGLTAKNREEGRLLKSASSRGGRKAHPAKWMGRK